MSHVQQFLQQLGHYSELACMVHREHSHTYSDLMQEIQSWHSRFEELCVDPGTVVGIHGDYSLQSVAALLALFSRGAIAALLPRDAASIRHLEDAHVEAILELRADGGHAWRRLTRPASHPLLDRLRANEEAGLILFTSGSTGRPKTALQSAERFLLKYRRPGRRLRTLAFLLFDHVAGQDTLFYTLSNGGSLVLTSRRDPASILELIESLRVEVLPTSPSFLRLLCAAKLSRAYDLSSLQTITYGSEPMDPGTLAQLNTLFPAAQISQKYGTTETGSPRSVSRSNDSLWLKVKGDGVETRIIDGVLWLRSEATMLGYLNAPSPIDEQGWYCTGDLVEVDGEWIRFLGRAADTINVGGEKLAPSEVEHCIRELADVEDVLVSGESHPLLGQIVRAEVALTNSEADHKQAARRIRSHCRERLAAYKVPVRIEFVTEGFTNARQKTQRRSSAKQGTSS